ncbi:TPA: VapE domain-containing protein [Photobacterium damselae]
MTDTVFNAQQFKGVQQVVENSIELFANNEAKHPREVLEKFMEKEGYYFNAEGVIKSKRGLQKNTSELKAHYKEWCQFNNVKGKMWSDDAVSNSIIRLIDIDYERKFFEIKSRLKEFEANPEEWQKLQKLTKWTDDDVLILRSWIWNIKQVIFGNIELMEQVPMPLLFSVKGGIGKSTFSRFIYSVVKELANQNAKLSQITDSFYTGQWGKLLVADFDEMSGHAKTDMTAFKTWYTSEYCTYRAMHSENINTVQKIVNSIGSSNKPLKEVLWDETGSRRAWEINCFDGLWKVPDQLDAIKLWNDIDSKAQCPLTVGDTFERIMTIQHSEQRRKTNTELFMADYIDSLSDVGCEFRVKAGDLYSSYHDWCKSNGEAPVKSSTFKEQVTTITSVEDKKMRFKDGSNTLGFDLKEYASAFNKAANTQSMEQVVSNGTLEVIQ